MPQMWCLANPKIGERDVAAALLDHSSHLIRTGQALPADEGFDLPLAAGGLGPLRVGSMTLQDIADLTGVEPEVNQQSFEFSGGTCFEAYLPGTEDVTLWIRSPEPVSGWTSPEAPTPTTSTSPAPASSSLSTIWDRFR